MHSPLPPATQHSRPERPQGMARSNRPEGLARQQAWRCRILHPEPMGISDALHARRQDADRQQSPGARYQNLCHWQKELAVQRHRRGSASAVVYSLMLTCRASRVEPLAWLRHVLTELPQRADDTDITDLLPFNFPKTAAA